MAGRFALVVSVVVLTGAAGCTEGGVRPGADGGPPRDGATSGAIRIDPADHVVALSGAPMTIPYRAFIGDREVTGEVTWSSTVTALGTFAGSTFTTTADVGGRTNIRARMGTLEGVTSLTLRTERAIITDGTPADAPTRFGGTPDPTHAPEIVYPLDNTMVPPNLGELEFHYRTGGSTIFELHVVTSAVDLRIYFGCPESVGGGCIYTPDRDVWDVISAAARGAGAFTYTLRGVDAAGVVGEAAAQTLTVAEENITGGLYYWNAGAGTIDRFEFGVRGAVAEQFLDTGRTGAMTCVGCHALSRDGRRIAVGTDIPTTTLQAFDVATRSRLWMTGGGGGGIGGFPSQPNFSAWSSDATQLVSSSMMGLFIRDGATGAQIAGPLGGGPASMPDFSPDGRRIVFVRHDAPAVGFLYDASSVQSGRIHTMDWDGSAWGNDREIIRGGGNNYYPAFSPDGESIVFNRSPSNTPSMGTDSSSGETYVPDAQLMVVRADGTGTAMLLGNASGLADSWPKWDPTLYMDNGRPIYWMAWSSRRAFGLRYPDAERPQLWMTAFDPAEAQAGRNPAFASFRLPFQDIDTGNHIAQWVTSIERMTCDTNVDCGGEFCVDGRCYEQPPLF